MRRLRNGQEFIHWLEIGGGARWVQLGAILAATIALSFLVAWKQFHGPTSESTLVQADMGRQLARGAGFTTLVNYPQTAAVLAQRGVRFDSRQPYPELHHGPFYSLVIAGGLRLLPASFRAGLFEGAPVPPDGFGGDYFLLGLNGLLLWLAAALTYVLGKRLFDAKVGWLAMLGLLLSVPVWQATVAVNGTPLVMVLVLLAFLIWHHIERGAERGQGVGPLAPCLVALGMMVGGLFLTEYAWGTLLLVVLGYAWVRFRGATAVWSSASVVLGFLVVSGPWVYRNVALTGHPVALAAQEVALKSGDPTAEPATFRTTLGADRPALNLRKLMNKTLTVFQENLLARIWSGGAMGFTAFFVAGWLYSFRSAVTNRLRWIFTVVLGVLLIAQAALNSGETERPVSVGLVPLLLIFGAGFFFVLLGSNARLVQWPRLAMTVLLTIHAAPLVHDLLEPRRLHFHYPPYFPALFQGMRQEMGRRDSTGSFGLMADVPAGLAWYGDVRAWAQPPRLRDFYAITLEQSIGQLLLTPRTLDRPFFSQLNARPILPGTLAALPDRFGEWGEIYAGLLNGTVPREFPLTRPQKLAENLYVLINPALPTPIIK